MAETANILKLTLHRQFFDEIASGTKTEEFRDRTDYWKVRLEGRAYDAIKFRNGYHANVPEMIVEWKGVKKQWSRYAIQLGRVLHIERWP